MHLRSAATFVAVALAGTCSASSLPTVNLGYQVHQALSFNETNRIYKFSNIRYAQSPVGDLRWAPPVAPDGVNKQVQNGSVNVICPQGMMEWMSVTRIFQNDYAARTVDKFNHNATVAQVKAKYPDGTGKEQSTLPGTSDDCLFLDVHVPEAVFKNGHKAKAPVMVWIHGGAYVVGNKVDSSAGDPTGLITASRKDGGDGIIYVSLNYRLGGLGFVSGETFQKDGGTPNVGLLDQRLALEWVQKYIHLFGGDRNQVTISGGSAGAGSVVYHLLSGNKDVPFRRVLPQSMGLLPASNATKESNALKLLEKLGVSSFEEARKLPSERIIRANADVISEAPIGHFLYAPVDDGTYLPQTAAARLRGGNVPRGIDLLITHTENEGFTFLPTNVDTDEAFAAYLRGMFPRADKATIDYIVKELYPLSEYQGLWYERASAFIGDYGIKCPGNALTKAYRNKTYNSNWSVFPAYHGYDFLSLFFNGNTLGGIVNTTYTPTLQSYVSNFIKSGNPNGRGLVNWPMEGKTFQLLNLGATGPVVEKDDAADSKCAWLQTHDLLL
ncbi:hypothetical protein LCI18_003661 [Fusarium solani-melongenae]|uniref:Uncharacterized protein n=1 Tax=Fusarium solani subsp. cucurbitae TaxID=2747967 RepID=A0ACD3YUX2_FUSSC|nr:hypothetical protein LCI18_003661 [Fusarium solani-melongenae]